MSEIFFVTNYDDWEGLYINGKRVMQNHNLSGGEVIEMLAKHGLIQGKVVEVDDEWLMEVARLPENLSEVKLSE